MARFFLAPVLAAGAVGMHFWLNVPPEGVRHSPRDQGAQNRSKAPKTRPRPKLRHEPRDEKALQAQWRRWKDKPFEDEPELTAWARQAEPVVNKAVVVARKEAFEGAPEEPRVIVTGTDCRTVRCRFMLRSPFSHELDLMRSTLEKIEVDEQPLWRSYAARRVEAPDPSAPKGDHYLEIVVTFETDDLSRLKLEVDEPDEPDESALGTPEEDQEDPEDEDGEP